MAQKDIIEKTLEGYNDVFADIVNGLLFDGEPVIDEKALVDATPTSIYKLDGGVHEEERDVAKYWVKQGEKVNVRISLLGMENQTKYDPDMPLRVMGYDGAAYRAELAGKDRYPVVTLVLNFSTKRWGKAKSLYDCLHVPEELRPYVSNYRINVFDIAFLTDEQISCFHNDFKIVADYFAHHRTDPDYRPTDPVKFRHTDELLKLFSVLMDDPRFEMTLTSKKGGKPNNMCEALDRIEAKGEKKGEKKVTELIKKLHDANRNEEIIKAASDARYRNKLYKEFQIN